MIVVFAAIFGAVMGAMTAKRRGGNRLDMAQYGGVFAILFGLAGLFVTIFIARMMA